MRVFKRQLCIEALVILARQLARTAWLIYIYTTQSEHSASANRITHHVTLDMNHGIFMGEGADLPMK